MGKRKTRKQRRIEIALRHVEIARGYDGPLRGKPEPVLLFGVYRILPTPVTVLSRRIVRLASKGALPERIDVEDGALGGTVPRSLELRILVLAAALEEDDSSGVQRLYAELESPERLSAWSIDAHVPDPVPVLEWARSADASASPTVRVHLVDANGDVRDQPLGDDWVGAALLHLGGDDRVRTQRRMHFVSADGRNDWTAVLEVRVR